MMSDNLSILSHNNKTIVAQCTPKGSGAIALIRLSGPTSILIASQISKLASGTKLTDVASHTIHFGKIFDENSLEIDQVMLIVMKAPKTFTGEDIVEITCHNNPFIIEQIITLSIKKGARLAQPGEFSKRAVINGKMDLLQAEAINEVINSFTQQALKKSLAQIEGSFSNWVVNIEQKLIKCLALTEASFEFIDEEFEFGTQILQDIRKLIVEIQDAKQKFNKQQQIKEGIRIVLIGSVNAGKSSLFNALLKKNRAIVSNIEGTTRDSIEAGIYNQDYFMTLVDTAGLRETNDIIEQEGIKRSLEEAKKADIILLIIDSTRQINLQEEEVYKEIISLFSTKIIPVINKIDLKIYDKTQLSILSLLNEPIEISAKNGLNIEFVENKIQNKISEIFKSYDSPFLLNQRQFNLLIDLESKLEQIEKMLTVEVIEYELLSIHINEAIVSISELSGKNISEKSMDTIFKEFCVGK